MVCFDSGQGDSVVEPAPPLKARRVGQAVVVVTVAVSAWLVASTSLCGSQADLRQSRGYAAMRQGQWDTACDDFREAASASILRDEAVFALHTCERVRANDGLTEFEQGVRSLDWERAKAATTGPQAQRKLQTDFVSAIENAR